MSEKEVIDISPLIRGVGAVCDEVVDSRERVAELTAERDELVAEIERLQAELNDEREHRTNLEAAIELHQQFITANVPAKSGRAADEALWWWVR